MWRGNGRVMIDWVFCSRDGWLMIPFPVGSAGLLGLCVGGKYTEEMSTGVGS